jgi:hypothetical protein
VPEQQWKRFAKQIEEERNPGRIAELAKELNEAMLTEEREKVRNRLRMPPKIGKELFQNLSTSRVENRRSDCSLSVAIDEAFAASPQPGLA